MATPAADWCNYGVGAGKSNYQIDYSTATGAGITTATPSTLASSTGISNIMYASADNSAMMLRSDVDVDVIASNGFPRTEGRERAQDGTTLRAFNPLTGDHWVEVWEKPTHLPPVHPSYVMLQMHDANGDIIEIAMQPRSDFATSGLCEIVARINGSSRVQIGVDGGGNAIYYVWPKLVATHVWGAWYRLKIYVGAIHSGVTGYEISCNTVTVKNTDNVNMPAMATSGANSYFKCGMYLQTKWTGSGTGGLETDRNEYGEAAFRDFRTHHNGETDTSVQVRGTDRLDTVSGVAWGAKASGHQTVPLTSGGTGINLTPGLPSGLVDGDMMFCIARSSRGINSTSTTAATSAAPGPNSAPSSPNIALGWNKLISTHMPFAAGTDSAYPSSLLLQVHTVRWQLWSRPWVSGDTAPTVTYAAGNTLTDTMTAQIFKCSGSKVSGDTTEIFDQPPNGLDMTNPADNTNTITGINYASATSTTVLGPTAALAANAVAGALAIACCYHETNATNTTIGVVTGGSDGLTWAEGGQADTTTVTPAAATTAAAAGSEADEPAWAHDWAIVPATAGQAIPAKQAAATIAADANKPSTLTQAGSGWGVLFTLTPAHRRHRRVRGVN
jgi:hypothetical protein